MKRNTLHLNNSRIGVNDMNRLGGIYSLEKYQLMNPGFLFDIVSTANLFMAFDHRRLRSGYTGPPVRIRKASDGTTYEPNFINEHFDSASALASVGNSSNGFNNIWYDQSGNGRNFTSTFVGQSPLIINNGGSINQMGDRQTSKGSTSVSSRLIYQPGGNFLSGSSMTIIMCVSFGAASSNRFISCTPSTDVNAEYYSGGFYLQQQTVNTLRLLYTPGYAIDIPGVSAGNITISMTWSGTSVKIRINGGSWNTSINPAGGYVIGIMALFANAANSVFTNNSISSFYLFTRVLTDSEISVIERNLGLYYGITVA